MKAQTDPHPLKFSVYLVRIKLKFANFQLERAQLTLHGTYRYRVLLVFDRLRC
ncbi:hypothetical protein IV102_33380 [bacterium]|nr:hypothetical protein [bacterium]